MTGGLDIVASDPGLVALAEGIAASWAALGTQGHFLAANPGTGEEFGFDVETPIPLASVAKVPIALAALELIDRGTVDGAGEVRLEPAGLSPGGTGLSLLRHPARIALEDLISLALTISDNAAADALIDAVGLEAISDRLAGWGVEGIQIRHAMRTMHDSASRAGSDRFELALELALTGPPGDRVIEALDPERANTGTARGLVNLLVAIWEDAIATPAACARLRQLMGLGVFSQRIAAELRSDTIAVATKTGTFLHLRHDIGVVETDRGDRVIVTALTRTDRRARHLPDVDLAIAAAARSAVEALRG